MEENWKILTSKTLVKDRWIDLRADECVTPGGQEVAPYYVLTYPDWVNVVALTPDMNVVLVRQYRHAIQAWVTELPGGVADAEDSDLASGAVRELLEETGYRPGQPVRHICSLQTNPAMNTNRIHTFLALDAVPDRPTELEAGEEGLSVQLVPISDVVDRMRAGVIGQAMHVAALSLALLATGHFKV